MPLFGPPNIESMEKRGDTAGLIKALDYEKEPEIGCKAVRALAFHTSESFVIEALVAAMQHKHLRRDIIHVLGTSGNPKVFEPLHDLLDTNWCVEATEALGFLGDKRACSDLKKIADHGGERERRAANKALTILGDPYAVDLLLHELKSAQFDHKANLVKQLDRFNDPRIVDVLLDLSLETGVSGQYSDLEKRININLNRGIYYEAQKEIKAKEETLQKEIRTTLKKIAAVTKEPLITAMQSQDYNRRKIALEILDDIGWKASSPDMEMKQWVINNQWEKFDAAGQSAFDFLVATLNDSNPDSPGHAAQALAKLHDQRAVAPIMAALKGRLSGWATLRIMESLAELDAIESIAPMMDRLKLQIKNRDYNQVRYSKEVIEKCLLHFQGRAVAPLAKLLDGNVDLNIFIIEILGKIGDPSAIPALLPQLESTNLEILKSTANSLRSLHWDPTQDDTGAKYHIYNQEWTHCSEMGEKAVPALLGVFHNKFDSLYQGAANVLKELYGSGKLTSESVGNILLLKGTEIRSHNDGESLSTCTHTDEAAVYLEL